MSQLLGGPSTSPGPISCAWPAASSKVAEPSAAKRMIQAEPGVTSNAAYSRQVSVPINRTLGWSVRSGVTTPPPPLGVIDQAPSPISRLMGSDGIQSIGPRTASHVCAGEPVGDSGVESAQPAELMAMIEINATTRCVVVLPSDETLTGPPELRSLRPKCPPRASVAKSQFVPLEVPRCAGAVLSPFDLSIRERQPHAGGRSVSEMRLLVAYHAITGSPTTDPVHASDCHLGVIPRANDS